MSVGPEDDETIRQELGLRSFRSIPFSPNSRKKSAALSLITGHPMGSFLFHSKLFAEAVRLQSSSTHYSKALILGDVCLAGYATELSASEITLDMCDDLAGSYDRRASSTTGAARLYCRLQASAIRRWIARAARHFHALLAVSELDRQALARQVPIPVSTVPLGVDTHAFTPDPRAPNRTGHNLLFVGAMRAWPNRDAAEWFAQTVLPLILRAHPQTQLQLVGSGSDLLDFRQQGVVIHGFCEYLTAQYCACDIFVCPLRVGTGIKNKMLEAMACGCAIVATSVGAEGLALSSGVHVLIADDPVTFAEAVVRLLGDADLRRRLGAEARSFAEQHLSLDAVQQKLKQAMFAPTTSSH